MRSIRVKFENGDELTTSINGTDEEIRRYYIGQKFQFGDTEQCPQDNLQRAVNVEFLDRVPNKVLFLEV